MGVKVGRLGTGAPVGHLKETSALPTWPEGSQGSFLFILPQPQRDEMLQQLDSRPSQNNSRKCQTSVSEMRPGEVSGTTSPSPPYQLRTQPDRMRTSGLQKLLLQHRKEHIAMYTCSCWPTAYFLLLHILSCMATSSSPRGDIAQTHWQPQNSRCDSHRLYELEHVNWCRASSWWWQQRKTGQEIYVGAKYSNSNMNMWSQSQTSSGFHVTLILPYKPKTQ